MAGTEILVSAASSLTEVFKDIGAAFTASEHDLVRAQFNFSASGILLQQILAGAPVDVFAAASPAEMDKLEKVGRLEPGTRVDFAANRLVLIVPRNGSGGVRGWADLSMAAVKHLAISTPASVPSGRYAQATLEKRGLWAGIQPKLVFGANVRQTLAYVAAGDADAGIVFGTDAVAEKRVTAVAEATPGRDHLPILYPVAVLHDAPQSAAARRFVTFLLSPAARQAFHRRGFLPPGR